MLKFQDDLTNKNRQSKLLTKIKHNAVTVYRNHFICILFSIQILIPKNISAQNNTIDSLFLSQLKQIKGVYDAQKGTYYSQIIDPQNIKTIHHFQTKKFIDGLGIIEYHSSRAETQNESKKTFGLIDTFGNILIQCTYEAIFTTENKNFYGFHTKDKLGIISLEKGEIFQHPRLNYETKNKNFQSKYNSFISFKNSSKFCVLKINGSMGVYSYLKEKIVVPTLYDKITLHSNIAICQTLNNFVVYNCENEVKSDVFKEVFSLKGGNYFFIRLINGKAIACSDPTTPTKSICNELINYEVLEFNNHHMIANKSGHLGLIDELGKECIPFIYDNIYFFDKELVLVKKNNLWAITDYQNKLLTKFQFFDVDKQNQVNFNNFIAFSGIDTTEKVIMKYFDYESGYPLSNEFLFGGINKKLIQIKAELYARKLSRYDNIGYPRYALLGNHGYQIITLLSKDSIKIDSLFWDNIFMVPSIGNYPFEIGVQKGNKFGYYNPKKSIEKYLKYDGIYFYYKLFLYESLMFSGTHNERSPYAIVKNDWVYFRSSYSKTNWLKKITAPPNWPARYQEKPKWSKYMNEAEFLRIRNEKVNR